MERALAAALVDSRGVVFVVAQLSHKFTVEVARRAIVRAGGVELAVLVAVVTTYMHEDEAS